MLCILSFKAFKARRGIKVPREKKNALELTIQSVKKASYNLTEK